MVQTLQAKNVTIRDLIDDFGIKFVDNAEFFEEWQDNLPETSHEEKLLLDRVKQGYYNLLNYPPLLEKTLQITIISPLLLLAGFFLPPFHIKTEKSVEVITDDEGVMIRGQIDVLILREQFWVAVIESKEFSYSIEVGMAQLLAYMLANPHPAKPCFGMIAAAGSFAFVKLVKAEVPKYAVSRVFQILNPGNDLYSVLSILRRLGQI